MSKRPADIRPVTHREVDIFIEHLERHLNENGRAGSVIFAPYSSTQQWKRQDSREKFSKGMLLTVDEPGWTRAWAAWADNRMVGHIDLTGSRVPTGVHRATIGMGLEKDYRGLGWGSALMRAAIDWARAQPSMAWLDLGVFAHNEAAVRLYRSHGFVETGRVPDLFRVDGKSIDDIQMSLRLRGY